MQSIIVFGTNYRLNQLQRTKYQGSVAIPHRFVSWVECFDLNNIPTQNVYRGHTKNMKRDKRMVWCNGSNQGLFCSNQFFFNLLGFLPNNAYLILSITHFNYRPCFFVSQALYGFFKPYLTIAILKSDYFVSTKNKFKRLSSTQVLTFHKQG